MADIQPFQVRASQSELNDLADRLKRTRWANELAPEVREIPPERMGPVMPGWEYGAPLGYVRDMVEYWCDGYNWAEHEARLNSFPHFTTVIDGQTIHFVHVRSPEAGALPLTLTHGWPNSFVEYLDIVDQLTNPRAHGGNAAAAFDVVIPSVPGFAYSGHPKEPGWDRFRTARAFAELMRRLGYDRYGAHGNDAGAVLAPEQGRLDPEHVVGVHVTQIFSFPSGDPAEFEGLSEKDMANLQFLQEFSDEVSAFAQLQNTKPQHLAHALADSPAGQLAWSSQLIGTLDRDHVLTNVMIYWLTNTGASAARWYYENHHAPPATEPTTVPMGLAAFAYDMTPLRRLAERDHKNIVSWNEYDRGGHWAAQDAPDLLVEDLQQFFRKVR